EHLAPPWPFECIPAPASARRLVGLKWLGAGLYPDGLGDALRADARVFSAYFYHRAPDSAQPLVLGRRPRRQGWVSPRSLALGAPIAVVLIACAGRRFPVTPGDLVGVAWSSHTGTAAGVPDVVRTVVVRVRGPGIGAATLVGAALVGAGVTYQGLFRNPLVS